MTGPATTVDDAYIAVNPDGALPAGDPYYEDFTRWRGNEPIAEFIARAIRRSNRAQPVDYVKQLFAGHRGCGKSSELLRLKAKLEEDDFFVVYFDSTLAVDINDVTYADVLLATMFALANAVELSDLDLTSLAGTVDRLRERLATLITEKNTTLAAEIKATAGAEVGGGIPGLLKLMVGLTSMLKAGSERKQTLRYAVDLSITVFLSDLNQIIDQLQTQLRDKGKQGLVLIVDSLDRIIPNPRPDGGTTHTHLFLDHADHLKAPNCHIVYTVPISIYFERNLTPLYTMPLVLPMVKVSEQDGTECTAALDAMEEAVARRIDPALFEDPADVRRLCRESGGHVRDLMHLLRTACNYSDDRISTASVDRAVQTLTNNYDRLVKDADLPRLVQVHREKRLPTDREYALLPYHLLVLEYLNGGQWADVHPAVRRTRKFQDAFTADAASQPTAD